METTRPAENFVIRHSMGIGFATVTFMVLGMAAMFAWQVHLMAEARQWVEHTYEVSRHIQVLSNKFKDAELGQRGYILSGDDRYLQPYNDAVREDQDADFAADPMVQHHSVLQEAAILRQMTKDNPAQQRTLDTLDKTVKDLIPYWDSTIEARRAGKKQSDINKDSLYGKRMMDIVRKTIRDMLLEENSLLAERKADDEKSTRENHWMTTGGLALFYIGMMLSVLLATRHWKRARIAEAEAYARAREVAEANQELQATNEQLSEFTQELQRSEEELKTQQEELESSNEEMEEKNKILEEQNQQIREQARELAEHKKLVEEKAKQLELSSKYKSEFLANMSHELRTPLNSLLILARSLAANEEGNLTEEQVEEAKVIYNGGLELLNLINDILDLSKVEAGKLNIISEEVVIEDITRRLEQQFSPIAKQSSVAFYLRVARDLPASFATDRQRVEQVLKNLLSNAFKFTQAGSVTLTIARPAQDSALSRASLDHGSTIAFSVTDTGIGIDESRLKDIFEAFQQEDGSTDRHYGGTGLGLTIARKFAHMLGGEIHVASKKGQGSTFTLVLPLAVNEQVTESVVAAPHEAGATGIKSMPRGALRKFIADDRDSIAANDKVLLIIEDDENFAQTLLKIARKRGYKVLAAGDGKSGILLASEYNVSAIILDLKLPDMDGMNVLDHLKHDLKTRHIPVHIITGRAQGDNVVPLRKGAIGYLTKPVDAEDIDAAFGKIESLLRSEIKKILVIEDDKKSQAAIQNLLRKKDVEITCLGLGEAALREVQDSRYDCIVLDLMLPDMTGFEWLEKIEAQSGENEPPPVIIYTAKDLSEDENRKLNRYTGSIVIKGASSSGRLLDEVTLFLHSVESTLTRDQQAMIRMQHDPDKVLQGRTALLVDDDMRNTFALSKLLKKHGMKVIIADNGLMALEKLAQEKDIEMVIMDIMMPVMDGYQAMREIRAKKEYAGLPVIALTARAMPEEQERCIEAGANDYMTKPVDVERLLTLMRVWLFRQEVAA